MKNDEMLKLEQIAVSLPEPHSFYAGKRLPANFVLPDNLLIFFHNYIAPVPNSHGRCTLVFPFDTMTYYIDGNRYELNPGTILYVPPYAIRFLHPKSSGYRRLFLTFDDPGKQEYMPLPGISRISTECSEALFTYLYDYECVSAEKSAWQLTCFLRKLNPAGMEVSTHQLPEVLDRCIEYIDSNLSQMIGIKQIANYVGLSGSHLRMLFRKEMGVSLGQFLARKRLNAAQYHLLHSDLPLQKIALDCGFSNVYAFSVFFKKNAGIPPVRFRKSGGMGEGGLFPH